MAYTSGNLILMSHGAGRSTYRYDTVDAAGDIRASGYFNNVDDSLNIAVGDIIDFTIWVTAVTTGTISAQGKLIVMAVTVGAIATRPYRTTLSRFCSGIVKFTTLTLYTVPSVIPGDCLSLMV